MGSIPMGFFSKTFDTVNHNILFKKLDHYAVCGTAKDWFISYLSNRIQHVSVGTSKSDDLYTLLMVSHSDQ